MKKTGKIFFISSVRGSLNGFFPASLSAYGQSRAALNYSMKELSFELKEEGFTVVAFHAGVVLSDMNTYAAFKFRKIKLTFVEWRR